LTRENSPCYTDSRIEHGNDGDVFFQSCGYANFSAGDAFADAMLDCIFHQRLNHESGNPDLTQLRRNFDLNTLAILKSGALDIKVGHDQVELFANRYEFVTRTQNTAQQTGEPHQGVQCSFRRRLYKVSNRSEGIKKEVWIDLSAQSTKFRLCGQFAHFLF